LYVLNAFITCLSVSCLSPPVPVIYRYTNPCSLLFVKLTLTVSNGFQTSFLHIIAALRFRIRFAINT
jgi:hypothetical protein